MFNMRADTMYQLRLIGKPYKNRERYINFFAKLQGI